MNITLAKGIVLIVVAASFTANAGSIYKWKDVNGRIHIGDRPPPASAAEQISVRAINTFSGATAAVNDSSTGNPPDKVVIYTTRRCGYCNKAKEFFRNNSVPYTEHDVETSSKGKRDYKRLKGRGVPIILIGNQRLNGFSEGYLVAALRSAGYSF